MFSLNNFHKIFLKPILPLVIGAVLLTRKLFKIDQKMRANKMIAEFQKLKDKN